MEGFQEANALRVEKRALSFYEWWVEEFGHPPLPKEADVYEACRKAYDQGWKDAKNEKKYETESKAGDDPVPQR